MKYRLIFNDDQMLLVKAVQTALEEGWALQGAPFAVKEVVHQCLVKEEPAPQTDDEVIRHASPVSVGNTIRSTVHHEGTFVVKAGEEGKVIKKGSFGFVVDYGDSRCLSYSRSGEVTESE